MNSFDLGDQGGLQLEKYIATLHEIILLNVYPLFIYLNSYLQFILFDVYLFMEKKLDLFGFQNRPMRPSGSCIVDILASRRPFKARSQKEISAAFISFRKENKISQIELSKRTKVRQSTISGFESGKISIQMETFLKLLNALDLEIEIKPRGKNIRSDIEKVP